ncbi:alpha/beta hydrolase family protein [Microbacterium dauci]|uniref:Alpha/beta fold hydrolase n=1 Tax=Microbacterium dauci TaxID=3048008 RepID=A0ABT6ZH06_9MICO|nr:alpha/beta fold hydrolase [Microbacterium sp. LX3-4]MDJ1115436.1 alpha/beta fold hydrolase [Microbacterium sp. LX3-4]
MKASRRAVPVAADERTVIALRSVVVALATALISVTGLLALLAGRVARRVVMPAVRVPDIQLLDVDTAAQTITVNRTPDTVLPGRYGLFTTGTQDYVKLGTVLSADATQVTRKLLTQIGPTDRLASEAAFSGWYFSSPEELHVPFSSESIPTALGSCPAWLFPAPEATDVWAIHIHGRGTTRSESLRAVPVFRAAGITSLLVSYRNDGEAPRSRGGSYALGATEWRDVDRALGFARRRGARRIVLMGWSMGGAIALQLALNSAHRDLIAGVVLDSPVVDWRRVLTYQARQIKVPKPLAELALEALHQGWGSRVTGADAAIPFEKLDLVARADELHRPTLILHSDGDDFVPPSASYALAAARPDIVQLERFAIARHTKLWNYDEDRWASVVREWLDGQGLSAPAAAGS